MGQFNWWEDSHPGKADWSTATMECGLLFAMVFTITQQLWPASNWDLVTHQVCPYVGIIIFDLLIMLV